MANPFYCSHGIAMDSYCNVCAQAAKLACIHGVLEDMVCCDCEAERTRAAVERLELLISMAGA